MQGIAGESKDMSLPRRSRRSIHSIRPCRRSKMEGLHAKLRLRPYLETLALGQRLLRHLWGDEVLSWGSYSSLLTLIVTTKLPRVMCNQSEPSIHSRTGRI